MPVTDAIHLVHGPIACAGNSWDNRGARSSGSQLYRRGFTTELLENDVVFGGEKKLRRAIVDLAARYPEAKAIFVYATCVTAMTGDDVEAVCRASSGEVPIPVIPVNTPGFIGDKNIGNRLAGEILLEHVIGTAEPATTTALRRQPHRRVQHRRRPVGDAAALRAARDPRSSPASPATRGSRSCAGRTAPG